MEYRSAFDAQLKHKGQGGQIAARRLSHLVTTAGTSCEPVDRACCDWAWDSSTQPSTSVLVTTSFHMPCARPQMRPCILHKICIRAFNCTWCLQACWACTAMPDSLDGSNSAGASPKTPTQYSLMDVVFVRDDAARKAHCSSSRVAARCLVRARTSSSTVCPSSRYRR